MAGQLSAVEALNETHDLSRFDCGRHASLNQWLRRYARLNQRSDAARTYVVHRNGVVVGYYSLTAGSVAKEEAPERIAKGLARHAIPIVLLARLAVDHREQGRGLGKALLKDALLRTIRAAETIAVRAILVHAIDSSAAHFYMRFGFEPSPVDEFHLMLLMKDLQRSMPH